jgi:hypothetical protein
MIVATLRASLIPAIVTAVLSWSAAAFAADAAGLFQVVVGDVRVLNANGQERTAAKGDNLYVGDRVVTADGALAQVKFTDGGLMSIRANSEFVLDKFSYAGPQDDKPSIIMSLVRGGLRSITGLIGKNNRDGYRINTVTATIGIRGTDHEPMVILPPPPGGKTVDLPGTYDKVNDGKTFLQTPKGVIEIMPRQVGFVPSADVAPRLLPKVPDFYRGDPPKQGAASPAGKPGESAADKSADVKADPKAATVRTIAPGARAIGVEALGTPDAPALATDKSVVSPAGGAAVVRDATQLSPATTLAPAASSLITRDSAILSPGATTLSPMTTQSPATGTIAPMIIQSPATTTIAPMTIQSPATTTIAPMIIQSPATTTIAPMIIQSPATTTIAPATSTIQAPATNTLTSPLLAPAIKLVK